MTMLTSSKHSLTAVIVAVAIVAVGGVAQAQRAAGPFADILGGDSNADATNSLSVRGSVFGSGYDTLSRTEEEPVDDRYLRSGGAVGASGSLEHALRGTSLQWQSNLSTSLLLIGSQSDVNAVTFNGDSSLSRPVNRRVTVSVSGRVNYSPYYDFAPTLDGRLTNVGSNAGGFGVATGAERNILTSASGGMNYRISRRDTFDAGASVTRYVFLDEVDTGTNTWSVSGRFNHTLSKSLSLHAGFGRTEASYEGLESATSNTIDAGVDYNDTLTFSRRTALSFGTSTSAVRWEGDTHYRVNANASLTNGFGRSGSASLNYQRATEFDPAFRDPVLTDMVSAGVGNQLGRRASWSAQAGYVRGNIGFESDGGAYKSVNAGGGVNIAITRHIGLFTDYFIYRYEVPAGSTVFTSLSRFSRQSVSVGLTLWAPLISKRSSK
jgi:hypothetical protein